MPENPETKMSQKFIDRHGLWSDAQKAAAVEVLKKIEQDGIQMIRLSWPDQYGLLRGKMLSVAALRSAFGSGSEITIDRKSTRLNSSHLVISYAVFCLKKKKNNPARRTQGRTVNSLVSRAAACYGHAS